MTAMSHPVIVRRHDGVQSYLVLDDNPRELLRHVGFQVEFSIRPWLGSIEHSEALEEWAEMMGEEPFEELYLIITAEHWEYQTDKRLWDDCRWPF
jgi:hypothetical protein